ncbi:MAG TPA: carbohydrate-binding protein, partial [Pontiella sp.]|nr:carbohydrate-binding protein [Pontiella sp.]
QNVAYYDTDAGNNGNSYRTSEYVDIEPCTDAGGGYNVGWTASGEWLKYTVDVATAGDYTITTRVASQGGGGAFHIEVDDVDVTGSIPVQNTGGWQNWVDKTASVTLAGGEQVVKLFIESAGFNVNYLEFVLDQAANTPPAFTNDPINRPNAVEGSAYSNTLAGAATDAESDPLSFSLVPGGPVWLSVATNGALSGTPGSGDVGPNSWTVQVSDGINSPVSASLEITVESAPVPPQLSVQMSGSNLEILWPSSYTTYSLYSCTNLLSPVIWSAVTNTPIIQGDDWMVLMPIIGTPKYFRLEAP